MTIGDKVRAIYEFANQEIEVVGLIEKVSRLTYIIRPGKTGQKRLKKAGFQFFDSPIVCKRSKTKKYEKLL